MGLSFKRIKSLISKEFLIIFRDPRNLAMMIVPTIIQLLLFSFAATLEIKNISLSIKNDDPGRHGHEIVQRISGSTAFSQIFFNKNFFELKKQIDEQKAMAALHIPSDFSQKIESGQSGDIMLIYDGRKSNSVQMIHSYMAGIVNQYNMELAFKQNAKPLMLNLSERSWFNENLEYVWFTIPGLVGILTMVITLSLASLSLAREKEQGTFSQLLVSPLKPVEILIGKLMPAMIIGVAEAGIIVFCGQYFLEVPFRGSYWLLLLVVVVFSFSIVGFGLFISSIAKTQQQAILGAFVFMVPAITLSGFAAPVENMPQWLQNASFINPVKYAMLVLKGVFLKDMSAPEVLNNVWPMALIGLGTISFAGWRFSKNLE